MLCSISRKIILMTKGKKSKEITMFGFANRKPYKKQAKISLKSTNTAPYLKYLFGHFLHVLISSLLKG